MEIYYQIKKKVKEFAQDGLRTLVFGKKDISNGEYKDWKRRLREGQMKVDKELNEEMCLYQDLEREIEIIGCTGVEDRL